MTELIDAFFSNFVDAPKIVPMPLCPHNITWNYLVENPCSQDKKPANNGRRRDSSYLAKNQDRVHYKDQTIDAVCHYNRTQHTNAQFHNAIA